MLNALLIVVCLIGISAWLLLGHRAGRDDVPSRTIRRINEVLPQTQCQQCGYQSCLPYAEAIVRHQAPIDRCPPGGEVLVRSLAELLGRESNPMEAPMAAQHTRATAVIAEPECIGCTICTQACPVDAIVGAAKQMHTVIGLVCTGCGLCVPPCPVDCIDLVPEPRAIGNWRWEKPIPGYRRVPASTGS